MNTRKPKSAARAKITPVQAKARVEAALKMIDWNAFWAKVDVAVEPQIEAYRRARARSYVNAANHWFF